MNVFIIIPVHNRREVTVDCLRVLQEDGVLDWAEVMVVDDGSTDGTGEAIQKSFPNVNILRGDGNLWWTGGILLGMKEAMRRQAEVILWLNDDCLPHKGTIAAMVQQTLKDGNISVGQVLSSVGGRYSGSKKTFFGLKPVTPPPGAAAVCDTFPGNLVAIPRQVVEEIGYLDVDHFPHVFSDIDYGLRARAHGFKILVLGDALADEVLILKPQATSWLLDNRPSGQLVRSLTRRTSHLNPKSYWCYNFRHWPVWGPLNFGLTYLKLGISIAIKQIVPRKWLIRIFGRHSIAWNTQVVAKDIST